MKRASLLWAATSLMLLSLCSGNLVAQTTDSVFVSFFSVAGLRPLASVGGILHADDCDSVRIVGLTFTWHSHFPPYQVQPLDWSAGRGQNAPKNFPLPPTAPGFPEDAHVVYIVYPPGPPPGSLDIDSLVPGRPYQLAPGCPTTGVKEIAPRGFALQQNYPNPFNPETEIRYQIPEVSRVTLKVFDPLGREVAMLVNEIQDAGFKSVTFNASNLASGMYFYRMQAGDFVQTKTLLLLK